jgi:putative membrane protein
MNALSSYYLLFKAIHIAFMVTWFAGLFYLPRLFIYHAEATDPLGRERFCTMERRLFGIMTIGAILTTIFGLILLGINQALAASQWFQIKLLLIGALIAYHYRCYRWIVRLRSAEVVADPKWLRWFNEIPVFFLFAIILLAVTKAL